MAKVLDASPTPVRELLFTVCRAGAVAALRKAEEIELKQFSPSCVGRHRQATAVVCVGELRGTDPDLQAAAAVSAMLLPLLLAQADRRGHAVPPLYTSH